MDATGLVVFKPQLCSICCQAEITFESQTSTRIIKVSENQCFELQEWGTFFSTLLVNKQDDCVCLLIGIFDPKLKRYFFKIHLWTLACSSLINNKLLNGLVSFENLQLQNYVYSEFPLERAYDPETQPEEEINYNSLKLSYRPLKTPHLYITE